MNVKSRRVASGVTLDRDVPVSLRDGVRLMANVFRPPGPAPVLMSVTPYGKDTLPDRLAMLLMRLSGVRFGKLDCSSWTGFEAPDPLFWTKAGYAVVQADARGMHKSEGQAGMLSDRDAEDYCELIEWAARQSWSTGAVGLLGVSYLAMSQWRAAALRPSALQAICPWEGATDLLRELGYQDGVPETGFVSTWWRNRMQRGRNPRFPMAEDFPADRDRHPLDDAYWAARRPALERIEVPALICASWSDHGLHTRGSLEGFERIGSAQKWLVTRVALNLGLHEHCGDIIEATRSGAAVDATLAQVCAEGTRRQYDGIRSVIDKLQAAGALGADLEPAQADGLLSACARLRHSPS